MAYMLKLHIITLRKIATPKWSLFFSVYNKLIISPALVITYIFRLNILNMIILLNSQWIEINHFIFIIVGNQSDILCRDISGLWEWCFQSCDRN